MYRFKSLTSDSSSQILRLEPSRDTRGAELQSGRLRCLVLGPEKTRWVGPEDLNPWNAWGGI